MSRGIRQAEQSDATAVATARRLLADGRLDEALAAVGPVLARNAANRDAAEVKIGALVARQRFAEALAAYDATAAAVRAPDSRLLAVIARSQLRTIAQGPNAITSAQALERLAREGDAGALAALKRVALPVRSVSTETLAPVVSLARAGDEDGTKALAQLLESTSGDDKARAISAIKDARARSLGPRLVAALDDPLPQVRTSAAMAIGALQFVDAAPRLQQMFDNEAPSVKMFAAVALKMLGRTTADAYVAELVRSEVPEVRLIGARAYQFSKNTQWVAQVKGLLSDRNEMTRLRAADLIASQDLNVARPTLLSALDSQNPLLREEAARIIEDRGIVDGAVARRLLGDKWEGVRLRGAGATLALNARGATRSPAR